MAPWGSAESLCQQKTTAGIPQESCRSPEAQEASTT